ncbi:hypothetical protein O9929_13870 [Vibrio lentus]|nr:hypothetical protein [Vibrio lentus]
MQNIRGTLYIHETEALTSEQYWCGWRLIKPTLLHWLMQGSDTAHSRYYMFNYSVRSRYSTN